MKQLQTVSTDSIATHTFIVTSTQRERVREWLSLVTSTLQIGKPSKASRDGRVKYSERPLGMGELCTQNGWLARNQDPEHCIVMIQAFLSMKSVDTAQCPGLGIGESKEDASKSLMDQCHCTPEKKHTWRINLKQQNYLKKHLDIKTKKYIVTDLLHLFKRGACKWIK